MTARPHEQPDPEETIADEEAVQADAVEEGAAAEEQPAPEEAMAVDEPQDAGESDIGIDMAGGSQDRVAELEQEIADLKDRFMRAAAEHDNLRKRSEREKEDVRNYAISSFARELVGVMENLLRAADSIPPELRSEHKPVEMLAQGVDMTLEEFKKALSTHGVERVAPEAGEKFDHNFHQAVSQAETNEQAPGTVVQVVQAGYALRDRLLKPAMVVVAKAPKAEEGVDTTA